MKHACTVVIRALGVVSSARAVVTHARVASVRTHDTRSLAMDVDGCEDAFAAALADMQSGSARKRVCRRGSASAGVCDDSVRAGAGGHDSSQALRALLSQSHGRPLAFDSREFSLDGVRLRDFESADGRRRVCPGDSALGAVYWIHKDAAAAVRGHHKLVGGDGEWFTREPWFPMLNVQPKANGMSVKPPPSFPVWFRHADPCKRDYIGVPRFLGLSHFGLPQRDLRQAGEPMAPGIVFDPDRARPFRPEQEAAFTALMACIRKWGGGFLEAECGFGTPSPVQ